MFKYIRIQIIQPCRARCAWCSTHRKNPMFQELRDSGAAEEIHDTYVRIIEHYRPREVFISGGEPLLEPDIGAMLRAIAKATRVIHVFTSYQFSRALMERIAELEFPEDKVILAHTPIYFEPKRWLMLTQGFPFDVYLDNVRRAVTLPVRKRFKFIINHSRFVEEIQRFQELVQPDESCEISLKVMNDQGAGLVVPTIRGSADRVHERLPELDALLERAGWSNRERPRTSVDTMKPVIESGDVTQCAYREDPLELRLALYKGDAGKQVLKYRYCPYFPPDFGHKFHVGRDPIEKLAKNYVKGPFREHCTRCRLLHYQTP